MLDFNTAEEQKEARGPIPPKSAVKVRLTLRQPKNAGQVQGLHYAASGAQCLDTEMEVVAGTYQGNKVWQMFTVGGTTNGQGKAAQISMRSLRAMVEAARGINPKDQSPQAAQGRRLNNWLELHGLEFGVIVECQKPKAGDKYVNNEIYRIITPDHELYQHVMAGGEMITDNPVPEIPSGGSSPEPGWAAPKTAAPQPPRQGALPTNGWGARPAQPATPPPGVMPAPPHGQAAPGWTAPAGMDDVPF